MEPVTLVNGISQIAVVIQQIVKDVKANPKQCKRLEERIDAITLALNSMNGRDLQSKELRKLLNNYRACIEQCRDFVTQFKDKKWYFKTFNKQNDKEEFKELNRQLIQCTIDLILGINLKQIFEPKLGASDQEADLHAIQGKVDEIAKLMVQERDELLGRMDRMEENIIQSPNQLFNQRGNSGLQVDKVRQSTKVVQST
ncbi:unnamed protein product [Rotaria sp. Silwood2]|nr:unnamed protein product [Rotaria sp. Silwood2]CAF4692671.1 unnamed protein product [Rotaria sp. Silwood2]